jgi:hypothetical protein
MFRITLPVTALLAIMAGPLSATTLADLSPTALPGKSLELTFEGGDSPTPLTGTWTATFEKTPANGITIRNFPGQSGSNTTTWTYSGAPFPDSHGYALASSAAFGNKPADITLWISVSGIRFYLTIDGVSNFGGAVFKSLDAPDISIQQPAGSNLTDGAAKKSFGTVKIGKSGAAKTFTIKNTGTTKLTKLAIKVSGAGRNDFVVGALGKTSLAAGTSTTFKVTFKPTAKGARKADIQIASNDPDENPFDFKLVGEGAAK